MKTRIKIITCIALICVVLISVITFGLLKDIKYNMDFQKPSRIVIYYNSENNNQVFEPRDSEYKKIHSLILNGCNKSAFSAFFNGELDKNVKIIENEDKSTNFEGIVIRFEYDVPQAVKYENKMYTHNDLNYWYQNLIFNITDTNKFDYNYISIIPPEDSNYYIDAYTHKLHYEVYSNFAQLHNYAVTLFK